MDRKYKLFCEIMQEMDTAYDLMVEYDSLPHKYGQNILYQAESHMIGYIGEHEGVTITELSNVFKKQEVHVLSWLKNYAKRTGSNKYETNKIRENISFFSQKRASRLC